MWKIINRFSWILNLSLVIVVIVLLTNRKQPDYSELNRTDITKIIDRYIDTSGFEHVVNTPVIINSGELNSIKHTNTYKLIDSLSNELKIANNRIRNISTVTVSSSFKSKGQLTDTIYTYKDSIINWSFNPTLSTLDFRANLKLNSVTYNDGKSFLGIPYGARTIYNNIWISDTNRRFKIDGVDNIIIKNEIPSSNLQISGKAEYRIKDNNILFGPEIEFNNKKVTGYFNYLYSPQNQSWEPIVGVRYYFLK